MFENNEKRIRAIKVFYYYKELLQHLLYRKFYLTGTVLIIYAKLLKDFLQ